MANIFPYIASNREFSKKIGDDYPNLAMDGSLTYFDAGIPYDRSVPFEWWISRVTAEITGWRVMIFIHGYWDCPGRC